MVTHIFVDSHTIMVQLRTGRAEGGTDCAHAHGSVRAQVHVRLLRRDPDRLHAVTCQAFPLQLAN